MSRLVATSSWLSFALLGWNAPLVPSLILAIEHDFRQTDAGIGLLYLVQTAGFAIAAVAGGIATERFGRRAILAGSLLTQAVGLGMLGLASAWPLFVVGGVLRGFGAGAIEGGVQALALDATQGTGAREVNLLHVAWSAGALVAPIGVALAVGAGAPWQTLFAASAVASLTLAAVFGVQRMPSGRRVRQSNELRLVRAPGLLALCVAIAAYVAAESGVGGWLVRFLRGSPLILTSIALSLFWGGLTVGRLVTARFGANADALRLAGLGAVGATAAIALAVASPSALISIGCFGLAGLACGPIFPMIIVAGARIVPGRVSASSGMLSAAAVVGGLAYPPVMGTISAEAGIGTAMLGTSVLAAVCAAIVIAMGRAARATTHSSD